MVDSRELRLVRLDAFVVSAVVRTQYDMARIISDVFARCLFKMYWSSSSIVWNNNHHPGIYT